MPITHFVKTYTQVSIADEAKLYDQSMVRANQDRQSTASPSLAGILSDTSHPSSEEEEKKPKKKRFSSLSKSSKSSESKCQKYGSNKNRFDDYKVDWHNKRAIGVKNLKLASTHFTEVLGYKK